MENRTCATCGAQMRAATSLEAGPWVGTTGADEGVRLTAICSNPDCPSVSSSDLAGPADGERERVERELGGDSGLADAH